MTRGKFIIFEGGEGSGKTTIIERLKTAHPEIVYTQDPGGTKLGEQIRALVLSEKTSGIDVGAELLLFLAARRQAVAEVIKPALDAGKNVISNRFGLSSIAYQIYGRERPQYLPFLRTVSEQILEGCTPDACILLDVTPQIGIARVRSRPEEPTRFDNEEIAFHERVREGYKKHIGEFGKPIIIDSDKPLEDVWTEVLRAVESII